MDDLLADGDGAAVGGGGWENALEAFARWQRCRKDRMFVIDDLVGGPGDTFADRSDPLGRKSVVDQALHPTDAKALDEQRTRTIDRDFGDAVVR